MERLTYRFSLDTHKNGSQRTLQGFETGDALARRFVVSLTENEETYDLPYENIVAVMYVKKPDGTLSYNNCTIENNEIIYDCASTDFEMQGTVSCQLKLIAGTVESPSAVLVSPRFDVEVWESLVEDSAAEATPTFTSLEEALIKAQAVYNSRITSFSFDEEFILTVVYGYDEEEQTQVTYETDIFKDFTEEMISDVIAHYPTIEVGSVTTGYPTSVTNVGTSNHAVFDFVIEKGDKGDKGDDGFSPIANVSKVGDTATITVTDAVGTTTASVSDGQDGFTPIANVSKVGDTATITVTDAVGTTTASVSDGADGLDGFSPIANVSKSGNTATISITDEEGTTTTTVTDGVDGIDGVDGFSPIANVSKSGNTTTISVTDKNGTTTATVNDGTDGDTVVWNQIVTSGTKIATIDINGNDTDVYAPTSGGGGATTLSGLDDVTINSASNGQALVYDSTATKWKNQNLNIPTVNNGTLTIQQNGTPVQTFTANQSTDVTANITVPTVNNGTLTIQKNGTNVQTFTANQSSNATANITVPTKTSDLTNDSGFITSKSDKMDKANPTGTGMLSINRASDANIGQYSVAISGSASSGAEASGQSSIAIGGSAKATKLNSMALGVLAEAKGLSSNAIGESCVANSSSSTAIGVANSVTGGGAFASGLANTVNGSNSYGFGDSLKVSSKEQVVIGIGNIEDANSQYSFIVGNGTYGNTSPLPDANRSNALTIDKNGKMKVYGEVEDGSGNKISDVTTKQATLVSGTNIKTINNTSLLGSGNISTKPYEILWTNPSPSDSFSGQTITVDGNINNYAYYEIVFLCKGNFSNSDQKLKSTGFVPVSAGTSLQRIYQYSESRDVGIPSYSSSTNKTSFQFANCVRYTSYGSSSTTNQNTICIPYRIIAWK